MRTDTLHIDKLRSPKLTNNGYKTRIEQVY